jgi:L-ribulokinase
MGGTADRVYLPREREADAYDVLFAEYTQLHDYFGRGANDVMHRLRELRRSAMADAAPQRSVTLETRVIA